MKSIPGLEKSHTQCKGRKRKHLPRLFFTFVAAMKSPPSIPVRISKGSHAINPVIAITPNKGIFKCLFCVMLWHLDMRQNWCQMLHPTNVINAGRIVAVSETWPKKGMNGIHLPCCLTLVSRLEYKLWMLKTCSYWWCFCSDGWLWIKGNKQKGKVYVEIHISVLEAVFGF